MNKPKFDTLTECERFLSCLDFNSLTSTAELELRAAVMGIEIDNEFTYGWVVASFIFKNAFSIMLEGIADGTFGIFTNGDFGPKIVFAFLFNILSVARPFAKLPSECGDICFSSNLYGYLIRREFNDTCDKTYSHKILTTVFQKNPLVIFKLYSKFGSILHSSQKYIPVLVSISKLISSIQDNSKYHKLRDAFFCDYSCKNQQAMFVR